MYVAPLVFAGAPIVNVIVSLSWHPEKVKSFSDPDARNGWIMFAAGILLAAVGAGLVLYSKGYIEVKKAAVKRPLESDVAQAQTPPV